MEVAAPVLLGPLFPALSFWCGNWSQETWPDQDSVDLAVRMLDNAF